MAGDIDDWPARLVDGYQQFSQAQDSPGPSTRQDAALALRGLPVLENDLAWQLVDQPSPTAHEVELGLLLARDATQATEGLDFAILDTYAVALMHAGDIDGAARVARRVLEVCDTIDGHCEEERERAMDYIDAAGRDPLKGRAYDAGPMGGL